MKTPYLGVHQTGSRPAITNQGTTVTDIDLSDGDDGTDTLSLVETLQFADGSFATTAFQTYTLQLLHLSDGEAGLLASSTAQNLAALVDVFEDQYANSITLSGGDTFLPGPFLAAGTDPSIVAAVNAAAGFSVAGTSGAAPGVVDTIIHNLIGVEASGVGNHEWDLGSAVYGATLGRTAGNPAVFTSPIANYVSVTANLDFSGDSAVRPYYVNTTATAGLEEASSLKGRLVPSAVITENDQKIGLVGVTTQILESISSPSGTEVAGFPFGPGPNGETNDMAQLAVLLQPVIDDLRSQGVNKIVLLSHLQQIQFEKALAPLLSGVDIILAAGSNTRLGDADDIAVAFPGHAADFADTYPLVTAGADGKTTLIVNTDNEYTYLGRLVVEFDANGEIVLSSVTNNVAINGAYAAITANVAEAWNDLDGDLSDTAFANGTRGDSVRDLTDAVQNVIDVKDNNIFGFTNVYLEGERIQVRNQETNLGNLSADANADAAREALGVASNVAIVSIKNGGGIRAQIGTIVNNPDGTVTKVPPELGGEVSQLDIENALRFDNRLMVFDTTPQGLLNILNSSNALNPNNGGFIQIGGVQFSYDPTRPAGQRVRDVALTDENGNKVAAIANDGVVLPGAPALITAVALNFTANGGDGYVIKANAENFRFVLNDGTLSAAVNEALNFTDPAVVPVNAIGEQQALAEFFQENHATPGTAYNEADTGQALDLRIQNQAARADTVLAGDFNLTGTEEADVLTTAAGNDTIDALGGHDIINAGSGNDDIDGGADNDTAVFAGNFADYSATRNGTNVTLTGPDGTDTIVNVESFQFSDGTRTVGQVGNLAPALTGTQAVLANGTEDVDYTVSAAQLLAGYTDANGDMLAVSGLTALADMIVANPDGSYTITPVADAEGPLTINYDVVDGNGGIVAASLGLTLDAVNDAPAALALLANSVPENSSNGSVVGTLIPSDVDNASGFAYALLDNAGGRFAVNPSTGVITVANGALLNFELDQSYAIEARVTDAGGLSFNTQLTIELTNVVETQTFTGTSAANVFTATSDDNWIIDGKGGDDILTTLGGIDRVFGGGGNDTISLGGGNDLALMSGGGGFDAIDGGAGDDTILATRANTKIGLTSIANVETINAGGNAGVVIVGSSGADMLDFSTTVLLGIESISGGAGGDTITGSAAADRILGGAGADFLAGSGGADVFVMKTLSDSGIGARADHVLDFVSGLDKFDISAVDASSSIAGNQAFIFIGSDEFTGLGQVRIGTDAEGRTTIYGNVSGNLNPDFSIVLDNNPLIQVGDFIL